jgi:outer membrane protein TolC
MAATMPSAARGEEPSFLADSLSIADCMREARTAAPEVRIAVLKRAAAAHDSLAASKNRYPRVDFFGGVHVAPAGFYDEAITNLGEYGLQVGVSLPLFDGGTAERERARAASAAGHASRERDLAARTSSQEAARWAIEILRLREKEVADANALARMSDLAQLLESRVRGGASGPSDLVRLGLERDAVQSDWEATRTDLSIATRARRSGSADLPVRCPSCASPPRARSESRPQRTPFGCSKASTCSRS